MAGPLSPQWVMSSGPMARKRVPGMKAVTSGTTVPVSAVRPSSSILKGKSEGTGASTSSDNRLKGTSDEGRAAPPVATTTMSLTTSGTSGAANCRR